MGTHYTGVWCVGVCGGREGGDGSDERWWGAGLVECAHQWSRGGRTCKRTCGTLADGWQVGIHSSSPLPLGVLFVTMIQVLQHI